MTSFEQIIETVRYGYDLGTSAESVAAQTGLSPESVQVLFDAITDDLTAEEYDYDDSMDGDFDSGMASAGFGTDEDYGCTDEF